MFVNIENLLERKGLMELKDHLVQTHGKGEDIHRFLDQYHEEFGDVHRVIFHHDVGINHIVAKFGEEARWVAEKHVMDDFKGKIPFGIDDYWFFPEMNELKYLKAFRLALKIHGEPDE